jgi:hypothetical protein
VACSNAMMSGIKVTAILGQCFNSAVMPSLR